MKELLSKPFYDLLDSIFKELNENPINQKNVKGQMATKTEMVIAQNRSNKSNMQNFLLSRVFHCFPIQSIARVNDLKYYPICSRKIVKPSFDSLIALNRL